MDEMKTETFTNRLAESERIKEEIAESERRLESLRQSLNALGDVDQKKGALSAWKSFLAKWREWDIDGFHHYLIRVEHGRYSEIVGDKAVFIQNWQRVVAED